MTITQTVEIPENHKLVIDVPHEVPTGRVEIVYFPASKDDTAENGCPICAQYRDPETGNPRYNAETLAAFKEGEAMLRGEIPGKWYSSAEEMWADLDKDDDD